MSTGIRWSLPVLIFSSHPWSHVVIGMWHKYPNPKCTHVVSIDVLDRTVDPKTGVIRTERVLGCKQKAPKWIVKVRFLSWLFFYRLVLIYSPALWRFRGRICTRDIVHRPSHTKRHNYLGKPITISICDMLREDTLHAFTKRP